MKTLALGIALSFFSFVPASFAVGTTSEPHEHSLSHEHSMEGAVHEPFEWSDEVLQAGEKELADCYECVFPAEWLAAQGEDVLRSMVVKEGEDLTRVASLGDFFSSISSQISYPVRGGARFLSGLGDRRSGGRRHQGVDLGSSMGTPIVAAWPGRVVSTGRGGLGGWSTKILHPNGLSTYYAHLIGPARVRVGQLVGSGEQVGSLGMSGNARGTTPHLHFEVRKGGAVLNPVNYIGR